jgi:hypothetical protein
MTRETVPQEVVMPTGRYIIELRDERTGKVQEVVKSNYISPVWANFAKWWQVLLPSFANRMVHNSQISAGNTAWTGAGGPFVNRSLYPFWQRPFPWQCVVLTDDTSPENSAEHWMKGTPTGWASMWKSASVPASGKRGQINEAECTISGNAQVQKKVWDWTTQQANGTYQTVGIGNIVHPNTLGDALACGTGPYGIVCPSLSELQAAIAAGPVGNSTNFINIADIMITSGKVFATVYAGTSGTNQNTSRTLVADVPGGFYSTDLDGSGVHLDLSGLTWTDITTGMASWTETNSTNAAIRYFGWRREIWYDTTDNDIVWTEIWGASFANGRVGRNDLTTKAAVWNRTWNTDYSRANAVSTNYTGVVKIGSFVYMSIPSTTASGGPSGEIWNQNIYRVNWSDGLGLTLIPMPAGFVTEGGLTTDGTDLIVWTSRGIVRMTTAGVITENYGYPLQWATAVGEYSLSPWDAGAGSTFQQQLFKGDQHGGTPSPFGVTNLLQNTERTLQQVIHIPYWQNQGGLITFNTNNVNSRHLRFGNGRLWIAQSADNAGAGYPNRYIMAGVTGANCFSRALLDAPVTKTSSQTMKVSYELTFPDMDAWVHDHPAI